MRNKFYENTSLRQYFNNYVSQMSVAKVYKPLLVDILMRRAHEFELSPKDISQDMQSLLDNLEHIEIKTLPKGYNVGFSKYEADRVEVAKELMEQAEKLNVNLILPVDVLCGSEFAQDAKRKTFAADKIVDGYQAMDIGKKTRKLYANEIKNAKTIIWNGPMGVFENPTLAKGTIAVAQALADSDAVTIVGGGDSAAACEQLGFADKITHISTGGGASLEFLEGLELPGIACLQDK